MNEYDTIAELAKKQYKEDVESILATAERVCRQEFLFTDKWDLEQAPFPVIFPGEIDWEIDPNGDPEFIWQFNRHRYFICLGQAYQITKKELYADKMAELLMDWIRRIPLTKEHEMKAWRSLEAGFRGENWTKAVSYIKDSPAFTKEVKNLYETSLKQHAEYIISKHSDYKYISNWGVIENHGLFEIALHFQGEERKRYLNQALMVLEQAAKIQFMEDGVHWEQSPLYHMEVIRCYLDILILAKKNNITISDTIIDTVKKGLYAMLAWRKPDGHMFLNGDSDDLGMEECFILGAWYFSDGRLKFAAEGKLDYETLWLLGSKGILEYEQIHMEEPEFLSKALPDSGHYYFRSGWGRSDHLLHFTCGTLGAGHGHSDKLHVDLVMDGRDVLLDAGRYTYAWDHGREAYKNPQAHNTILADGKLFTICKDAWECSKLCEPVNTAYRFTDRYAYVQGGHLGYIEEGIMINRKIIHIKPDIYLIADEMYGSGRHTYDTYFHFNEAGKVIIQNDTMAVYQDHTGIVKVFTCGKNQTEGSLEMKLEKSKVARHYNEEAENDCLHIRQTGDGFASLYTVFAKENVISCERILTGSVLKSIPYEAKKAEAVKIITEETEYIIIICHQEVNSPTDLIGADDCKGFGNVIVFDKNEGTFGGTVLHW